MLMSPNRRAWSALCHVMNGQTRAAGRPEFGLTRPRICCESGFTRAWREFRRTRGVAGLECGENRDPAGPGSRSRSRVEVRGVELRREWGRGWAWSCVGNGVGDGPRWESGSTPHGTRTLIGRIRLREFGATVRCSPTMCSGAEFPGAVPPGVGARRGDRGHGRDEPPRSHGRRRRRPITRPLTPAEHPLNIPVWRRVALFGRMDAPRGRYRGSRGERIPAMLHGIRARMLKAS
jgi:hypothetical protein